MPVSFTPVSWCNLLRNTHHKNPYDKTYVEKRVNELLSDKYVHDKTGIFEYILSGEKNPQLLDIRIFESSIKETKYALQTQEAKNNGVSNCPLCAIGNNSNKTKIWKIDDMEADHVTAWSKGGKTDISNCEMLCKTHNRSKGNR